MDAESFVQERALDHVGEILFTPAAAPPSSDPDHTRMAFRIMDGLDADGSQYLKHAIDVCAKQKRMPAGCLKRVLALVAKEDSHHNHRGAWIMLSHLAPHRVSKVDPALAVSLWERLKGCASDDVPAQECAIRILGVLSDIAGHLPDKGDKGNKALAEDVLSMLQSFSAPPDLIAALTRCLTCLVDAKGGGGKGSSAARKAKDVWCKNLLSMSDDKLYAGVSPLLEGSSSQGSQGLGDLQAEDTVRQLFTAGEVVLISQAVIPKRLRMIVQALLSNSTGAGSVPPSVRGHAFITLGKFCLRDESLAKTCIALFVKELETDPSPVVRNNILVILTDLCVRYTALVDRHVMQLSVCLRDNNLFLRRHTLCLLTQLLQAEYVKWKGALFFRYVVVLVDESAELRDLTRVCLLQFLLRKQPALFYNNFIETFYTLNGYTDHPTYNQFSQSTSHREKFAVEGPPGSERSRLRMEIYKVMLGAMSDEHKFQITSRLSKRCWVVSLMDKCLWEARWTAFLATLFRSSHARRSSCPIVL